MNGRRGKAGLLFVATAFLLGGTAVRAQVELSRGADGRVRLSNDPPPVSRSAPPRLSQPPSELLQIIEHHASEWSLDPLLVRALIQVESGYDATAVSHKGAMGLMQLMPRTAAQLQVTDPFDPDANVRGGTEYLRLMLDVFENDLTLALAGYNAGPETVRRYGGVPPYAETREYLRRVLSVYQGSEFVDIPESSLSSGRKTYLVRQDGRMVMTTTPPRR